MDGSPADCTRVGLLHLWPEAEWVVSGINRGGNLGADVYTSGTVAAAREAALWGRQAIAISQYIDPNLALDWDCTAQWARVVLEMLLDQPLAAGHFWNVNLPHIAAQELSSIPEIVHCPLDVSPHPVVFERDEDALHYRGVYRQRPRQQDSDVDNCFSGRIAVSELTLS